MFKSFKKLFLFVLLFALLISSVNAYDIPERKIEVKPYLNLLMAKSFWEGDSGYNLVDDKTGIGFGVKIRTQIMNNFGMVLNASLTDVEVSDNSYGSSVLFAFGGYYSKTIGLGNFNLDCGYGFITAGDEVMGLLIPSLEYSRPLTERVFIAFEIGWPIANDWLKGFEFKENYSSFTLSLGGIIVF